MPGIMDGTPGSGADYYCSNLHKWCFAPTACAFLWVSPSAPSRKQLHHPIISHRFNEQCSPVNADAKGKGAIVHDIPIFAECAMLGTKDYSPTLVIPETFKFVERLGGLSTIRSRNKELSASVVSMLSEAWGTIHFTQHPTLRTCSLTMIGCPSELGDTPDDAAFVWQTLREKYDIVVQKLFPVKGDRLYLRLSVAVYNSEED